MENIKKSAAQLIGHTPLMELCNYEKKYELQARIIAKLEYFNPAGSAKDRVDCDPWYCADRRAQRSFYTDWPFIGETIYRNVH